MSVAQIYFGGDFFIKIALAGSKISRGGRHELENHFESNVYSQRVNKVNLYQECW